jgi:hypothetical protein
MSKQRRRASEIQEESLSCSAINEAAIERARNAENNRVRWIPVAQEWDEENPCRQF